MSTRTIGPATTWRHRESWPPRQLGDLLLQQDVWCVPTTLDGSPAHQEGRLLVNPHDRHNNHVATPGVLAAPADS